MYYCPSGYDIPRIYRYCLVVALLERAKYFAAHTPPLISPPYPSFANLPHGELQYKRNSSKNNLRVNKTGFSIILAKFRQTTKFFSNNPVYSKEKKFLRICSFGTIKVLLLLLFIQKVIYYIAWRNKFYIFNALLIKIYNISRYS